LGVGDGVATVYGLTNVQAGELVLVKNTVYGLTMNLQKRTIGIVLFESDRYLGVGDTVTRTHYIVSIPNGSKKYLGRVVDPLGNFIDGLRKRTFPQRTRVDIKAPGIVAREAVSESLFTGVKGIDCLIPIGRGQRELIVGDRQTGKSAIATDAVMNQKAYHVFKNEDKVFCIYVVIGQKKSTLLNLVRNLKKEKSFFYTIIVAATASDSAAAQYLAPYSGCTLGEFYRNTQQHALVIYDDLSKQAVAYRQISLLLRRPPGREAFPGDVFYLHSRLLERAAKMSEILGGGSLTALPIVETQEGDVSAYIPTNVISITDGQVFLEKKLVNKGILPAINFGISVSRVGAAAQAAGLRQLAGKLKWELAEFKEVDAFISFGQDLDPTTIQTLHRGIRLVEMLKQRQFEPVSPEMEILSIMAGLEGFLDKLVANKVQAFLLHLKKYYLRKHKNTIDYTTTLNTQHVAKIIAEALSNFEK